MYTLDEVSGDGCVSPAKRSEPLKDTSYFKTFTASRDIDTTTRPNDADFPPDYLYEIG
jgi:hypothetical protein